MGREAVHLERLVERAGRPVGALLAVLCGLELQGVVEQVAGRRFRLSPMSASCAERDLIPRSPPTRSPDNSGSYFSMHLYLHVPFCARRCSYCDFAIAVRREVPSDRYVASVLTGVGRLAGQRPVWKTLPGSIPSTSAAEPHPTSIPPASPRCSNGIARRASRRHRRRDHAGGQSRRCDSRPRRGLARRGREPHLARRAVVRPGGARVDAPDPHGRPGGPGGRSAPARRVRATSRSISSSGFPPRSAAIGTQDLDAGLRTRAGAPVALRAHGRGAHAARPVDRARRGDAGRRGAICRRVSGGCTGRSRARATSITRSRTRRAPAAGPGTTRAYWRRAPFIGLGPSAHSGFGRRRQWNLREWTAYERAIAEGRSVVAGVEDLSPEAVELEEIYLGLRTTEGLPTDRLPPESVAAWTEAGWAVATAERIRLTAEGWLRLDALAAATP